MNATQQQRALQGIFQASQQLAAAAQAFAGGNGGIPTIPALYLDFLPEELRGAPRDFFTFGVDFLTIAAAGASATESFTVPSDSDFLIVALSGTEVDPADEGTAIARTPFTIAITDSGSGRQLQNRAQAYANVVGTGQLPSYLPFPKFIDRSSQVSTTIVNNDPTQAARIRLSFLGFKIFDMMRGGR
ncbi:MAG: hypothetical protein AB7T31_16815 [Gemmatimonadales bacterium]